LALSNDAVELELYFVKPSSATAKVDLQKMLRKATHLRPPHLQPVIGSMTEGQMLNEFEKTYQAQHTSPQELKSMKDPSTQVNKDKIMWGLSMRMICIEHIPYWYLRGLDAGWFENIPQDMLPSPPSLPVCVPPPITVAERIQGIRISTEESGNVKVDWNQARLVLIYVINYGLQVRFARQHLTDERVQYRLINWLKMIAWDTLHGPGRICQRILAEIQQAVITLKPPSERSNINSNARHQNMNYFMEAIVFNRQGNLQFDDATGAPLWPPDEQGQPSTFTIKNSKSSVQLEKNGNVKPIQMTFGHTAQLFVPVGEGEDPLITRYLRVGFAEYLNHPNLEVRSRASIYYKKSKAVNQAWVDLQHELKRKRRPLTIDEEDTIRPLIIKFTQLYREKEGAQRISNYIWYIMSMAVLDQMKRLPVHAICNQSCENKINLSRRYVEHNTSRHGHCGPSFKQHTNAFNNADEDNDNQDDECNNLSNQQSVKSAVQFNSSLIDDASLVNDLVTQEHSSLVDVDSFVNEDKDQTLFRSMQERFSKSTSRYATYPLGRAMEDRFLVLHALNMDLMHDDDDRNFTEKFSIQGQNERNAYRRWKHANRTEDVKQQESNRRKMKRKALKEHSFKAIARVAQSTGNPQNYFIQAAPYQRKKPRPTCFEEVVI
jgi:hypothetical protein